MGMRNTLHELKRERRSPLTAVATALMVTGLVACGGGAHATSAVVVRVGPYAITKAMVDHVITQEALEHAGPRSEHPGPSHAVLFRDGLNSLISYDWVIGEATEAGVNPNRGELEKMLSRLKSSFHNEAKFQAFLKELKHGGKGIADLLLSIRLQLATQKIFQLISSKAGGDSQEQATAAFVKAWRAKWLAKTHCATGYIVEKCADYSGPRIPEDPYTLN
jgi:hypothetical protein